MKYFLIIILISLLTFIDTMKAQSNYSKSCIKYEKETCTFDGSIYIGDNLLENGDVFLFQNIGSKYSVSEYEKLEQGYFKFNKIKNGNYTIYIIPDMEYDFLYFPKYLPTYSGSVYRWEKSVNKLIDGNTINFKFHLNSYHDPFYGKKSILGKIKFQQNYIGDKNIPIVLFLLNEDKVPMDFRRANYETGEFCFNYLPNGKYYIHPEIPGIYSQDFEIAIEDDENEVISFQIENERVVTEKEEEEIENTLEGNSLKLYLNDFKKNSQVICELINISGKSVLKNIYNSDDVNINTSSLATGIYILRVCTYNYNKIKTQKVYINNYN